MAPTMRDIPPLDDEENDVTSERLSSNEIAAVHSNRRFYVNDVPSPYLSKRQAREDVEITRRRHMIISTVMVMILLCAMAAGIGWYVWDTLKPEEKAAVPKFNTATIVRKEFVDSIDSASIVRPVDERPIISNISGTISEVLVEEGQFVEEEDPLYTIDNPSIIETFQKAQEALDAAQGDVDRKQEAVDRIRKSVEEAQQKKNEAAANASANSNSSTSGSTANGGTNGTEQLNAPAMQTGLFGSVQTAFGNMRDFMARIGGLRLLDHGPDAALPEVHPLTDDDYAAGTALSRIGTNETYSFDAPTNAVVCRDWLAFGATRDLFRLKWSEEGDGWTFPWGTNRLDAATPTSTSCPLRATTGLSAVPSIRVVSGMRSRHRTRSR